MENIIFKLFERQPNWALKALVQETDQPEVFPHLFPDMSVGNASMISRLQLHIFLLLFSDCSCGYYLCLYSNF
jgi:hypothetical protein